MPDENHFKEPKKQTLFENEEEVLRFWKKNKIFEKSLEKNPKEKLFSFYDGPPFITGLPHYATLLPSIAKDIIPRYQTMKGRYVPRVWGWDVHGLPVENKVEEQLSFKSKKDIEDFGIDKFIAEARKYVAKSSDQWKWYIDRIGRWADMERPYRTDDRTYVETVLWVFKELYNKNLIYKGQRVLLYCTRCATVLSKFEVTMDTENYKDIEDPAVTVAFKLKGEDNTYVLAWTTTPWTLPANNGLAVGSDIEYVKITDGSKSYILAKDTLERYPEFQSWETVETMHGKKLEGKSFEPLLTPNITPDPKKDYKIYTADFATTDEGTGIVHIAPAFGEDDFNLGQEKGLTVPLILDDDGKFSKDVPWPWTGKYFKDADPDITAALKEKGLLVREDRITHSYPHCYRCGTPLIYMAQDSWLFKIDKVRKQLLKTNKKINWVPKHFGEKRFAYNIESAPDWSISRTRYWGIPIPIWETEDGERVVVGSIKELEELSGQKVTDLHRPVIDDVVLTTPSGKKARRVKEVLDVWFESGSMPYAQDHYPFENKEQFEAGFPADYIIEYTGQLRGWFYYLHVLSNALFEKPAFKNVSVTGVLMGTDGRKMSKSYGNYPDPKKTLEKYGAESLRMYFMGSKIMNGEDLSLNEDDIREQYNVLNILHNSHKYLVTYANLHNWQPTGKESDHILDKWISARTEEFIKTYSEALDNFDFVTSTRAIRPFVEDLSTWYIRRSRDRFASGDTDALETLYGSLTRFAKAVAPTLPFTADYIYQALKKPTDPLSVHLCDYPKINKHLITANKGLLGDMELVRDRVSALNKARAEWPETKQPLPLRQKIAKVVLDDAERIKNSKFLTEQLREEINAEKVEFDTPLGEGFYTVKVGGVTSSIFGVLTDELKKEGIYREIMRALQDARKKAGLEVGEKVPLSYSVEDTLIATVLKEKLEEIKDAANFSSMDLTSEKLPIEILDGKIRIKLG